MKAPQIIIIVLYALSLGVSLAYHGKERTDKYNFWSSLLACVIVFACLTRGGFF